MAAPVVIVGAGQGGLQAAESLRSEGFSGDILLLGAEPHAPYHRPPLSKGLLLGETTAGQLAIRQPTVFERKGIALRPGTPVAAIDAAARTVTLDGGERLDYAALVLATGARPRRLPVPGGERALCLRGLDDAQAIAARLPDARRVVVVGGGFIGLEMAAVARTLGKEVTVVEAAGRLMARVAAPPLSLHYHALHEERGCTILLNAAVAALEEGAVVCADGRRLPADLVVLGIGVEPETALAEAAGLECDRGVVVDGCGRTSAADVYAIGDCAARRMADGSLLRLESVQNAVELGKACAAAIVGREQPFMAAPWFWSDQYDAKLQMVGLSAGADTVVTRGHGAALSWFHFRAGRLVAIDSINRPADHMAGRKLLAGPNSLTLAQAADEDYPLKEALPATA
ncbi:NAD(P)/FAD-dependent oxidoreductase [Novispirillum sp. DQ9]|uniref:NAD(P)/FAD-dependent oxidoreductase n=1 Tax=Novispirillum sp. DQ9 TaxID=3398612 RepID=UPI003C7D75C3